MSSEPWASATLPGMGRNFSDAAFVPQTNQFLILDDYCQLIPVELRGQDFHALRSIKLNGLEDCEALAYVRSAEAPSESYQVAVGEEKGSVAMLWIGSAVTVVDCPDDCEPHKIEKMVSIMRPNTGLEALAVDARNPDNLIFYAGREEGPRKFYRGVFQDQALHFDSPWDAETMLPAAADIAGAAFFAGRLFLLDEHGGKVREIDPASGRTVSEFTLPDAGKVKYEGLAFALREHGAIEMLIAAEPDRILIFRFEDHS